MIPVNPVAAQGLADIYRQQRAIMDRSRDITDASKAGAAVAPEGVQAAHKPEAVGFGGVLDKFVNEVNAKQLDSTQAVNDLLGGKDIPLHQVMVTMQEAGVAFQLMVEVRNKLLEGYQQLMRMQI
ncbi:flagellar hook-basal body complex protein FliE [Verrucomicrobia bacterium]|nr:flagellar hook-basal body complex protein FliE [Verrucomicrobiota bacterium]